MTLAARGACFIAQAETACSIAALVALRMVIPEAEIRAVDAMITITHR